MSILVLAPHADDEVLGAGGIIALARKAGKPVTIAVITGHGETDHPIWPRSAWDTVRAEAYRAAEILGGCQLVFRELPAACLDSVPTWKTNNTVQELIREVDPEELYVPFAHDLHKDHTAIAYAAQVATRPYLAQARSIRRVLAYETLSETHLAAPYLAPAFQPNCFVDVSTVLETKLDAMRAYESQLQTTDGPRSIDAMRALARLHGSRIGVHAAEAFFLIQEVLR